jgi:orotate phosphoribosyltransferase
MTVSSKAVAAVTALAIGAVPAASIAATKTPSKAAVAACKAEQKKLGKTKFQTKYGKTSSLKKCETAWSKAHPGK